jgi:hypothetical protein
MKYGFFDPQSEFVRLSRDAAAAEWGKAAADFALMHALPGNAFRLRDVLDRTEPDDIKQLRTANPAAWAEIRAMAEAEAEAGLRLMTLWR